MSCRGSPIKGALLRIFSFTRWGLLFCLLSLTILAVGLLRMELAAILWGGAFALLAAYALLANRIMRAVLRRHFDKIPDPVDFTLPPEGVFPAAAASAQISVELPRFRAPGIRIDFEISLHWPGRDPLQVSSDLHGGRNCRSIELIPRYRGCYRSRQARVVVSDALGFTRRALCFDLAEGLRVYPSVQPRAPMRAPRMEDGREENRRRHRRSEELLEVRKYFPGDDIRKVHWKVFAHTSELFLRIGEETPPPESRFLVILDSAPTAALPEAVEADYLDILVERCAAAVLEMLGRGFQVFFALCDAPKPREITPEKQRQLLAELAGVWWSDRYTLSLPRRDPYQVFLFSSPGSANLPRLFADLERRGAGVKLLFPQLTVEQEHSDPLSIRRLLFRTPVRRRHGNGKIGREELESFQAVLDREIGRWNRRGRWKVAVETI
ncbi:MAG: DUF58 domain-containing protein [Spirochaetales bacterium]|nr:DUF58 domain-containing protein [Spirochaetales bacterium]